jgi:hypothetical protein
MIIQKLLIFLTVHVLFITPINAQSDNYPAGARAAGMGGTSVMLSDLWANYHNQAALGFLEDTEIGIHHENRYIAQELSLSAIAAVIPTKTGNFGANISYFGYNQYHESKIGLAYSKAFGDIIAAGIQFDYLYTFVAEEYGSVGKVIFEAGFFTEPIDNLTIGFHVFNPTQTKIERLNDEPITTALRGGIGYSFDEVAFIGVEMEHQLDYESTYRVGIEYQMIENLFFRVGINTYPREYSLGLGYKHRNIRADIAFTNHQPLGITPHFSFSYAF